MMPGIKTKIAVNRTHCLRRLTRKQDGFFEAFVNNIIFIYACLTPATFAIWYAIHVELKIISKTKINRYPVIKPFQQTWPDCRALFTDATADQNHV